MKFLLFLLIILVHTQLSAQESDKLYLTYAKDTIYADENNNIIDKHLFNFKFDSSIYYGFRFETDKIVVLRLRFSHLFGTLETTKKEQLFKLLASRNHVDTTKIMLIHYQDTLKRIVDFPKEDIVVFNKDSSSHTHIISHKSFVKQHENCLKGFKRNKKTKVYHFFGINKGHPLTYENNTWEKDNFNLINNMFRDKYRRFSTIIINPNGNFYCYNFNDEGKNLKVYEDIIKDKKWDEHMNEFSIKLQSLNSL